MCQLISLIDLKVYPNLYEQVGLWVWKLSKVSWIFLEIDVIQLWYLIYSSPLWILVLSEYCLTLEAHCPKFSFDFHF